MNDFNPGTIFITGISASGKSTLGATLRNNLVNQDINNVKLLDGDEIRKELTARGKEFGYTVQERNRLAIEIAHMALDYNREGIICIVSSICHVKTIRKKMRGIVGNIIEVYLNCPVHICAARDYKGNYEKAFKGLHENFIGVTEPYQVSDSVELVLHTGKDNIDNCSKVLLDTTMTFLQSGQNAVPCTKIAGL